MRGAGALDLEPPVTLETLGSFDHLARLEQHLAGEFGDADRIGAALDLSQQVPQYDVARKLDVELPDLLGHALPEGARRLVDQKADALLAGLDRIGCSWNAVAPRGSPQG